jgi:sugar lactone lactonase YvrE
MALTSVFLLCALLLGAQKLDRPESIAYDASTGYYYISNTGNGTILKSKDLSAYSLLAKGLGSVRGLYIVGRTLYGASDKGLLLYDLDTGAQIKAVAVPGSSFLNDVTADNDGNVYITDHKAHKIFRYNGTDGKVSTFVGKGIQSPNGIVFDARKNRLLFVSLRSNSPIQAIALPGGELSTFKSTATGNLDGFGIDKVGNLYWSSWQTSSIYRLKDQNSSPEQIVKSLSGPADFYLLQNGDSVKLIIPQMTASSIAIREYTPK